MTWDQYHRAVAEVMDAPEPALVHIPTDLLYEALPAQAEWLKENFQFNNIFSNQAAKEDLGFRYTISWREGVQRVAAWLDERGQITAEDEPAFYDALIQAWEASGTGIVNRLGDFDHSG
jgi:nucleoside-diphosphate-sugar epimerase